MVNSLPLPSVLYRNEDVDRYLSGGREYHHHQDYSRHQVLATSPAPPVDLAHVTRLEERSLAAELLYSQTEKPMTGRSYIEGNSFLDLKSESMVKREAPLHTLPMPPVDASSRPRSTVREVSRVELGGALRVRDTQIDSLTDTILALTEDKRGLEGELVRAKEAVLVAETDRDIAVASAGKMQSELEEHSSRWKTQAEQWEEISKRTLETHRREVDMVHHSLSEACGTIQKMGAEMKEMQEVTTSYKADCEALQKQVQNLSNITEVQQQRLTDMATVSYTQSAPSAANLSPKRPQLASHHRQLVGGSRSTLTPERVVGVSSVSRESSVSSLRAKVLELERRKVQLQHTKRAPSFY